MNKKLIATHSAAASRSMGPHVKQVIPSAIADIDPFVFLDHFGPFEKFLDGKGVPPHPHAGIATITYLFSGSNRHQDSYQHEATIHAGDLAWMQAGKGIVHAEGMNEKKEATEVMHGLQIWISLPAKDKFIEPDFFYYKAAELPYFHHDNVYFKVICGELLGHISPVKSLSPAYIFEVKAPANSHIEIPIKEGDSCGIYMLEGTVYAEDKALLTNTMTKFSTEGDSLKLSISEESHFVILGGTPLNEPIVAYASFVMNSSEQIRQVIMDYQQGKMGTIDSE